MTQQVQSSWRVWVPIWTPSNDRESWEDGWSRLFGNCSTLPQGDEYEDGEGGYLRFGEDPRTPGIGNILVRVWPPDKHEIRRWVPPADK